MDEKQLAMQLEREGFGNTYVWQDGPGAFYPEHAHEKETAHIILRGELTLSMDGRTETYCAGQRCDVPPRTVHAAKIGPRGCRYLIGER
ncbi:MAG TPA: cupin domain-containing protein [Candidatus Acidoferrum sp.]|nr:cupin domain-containing protein [Candidatus Acidoferrum sp.]